MEDTLLEVRDLQVEFSTKMGIVRVLDKVNLKVDPRQTVGIIGESGCGKSMMALSIMGLVPIPPGRIAGGEILYRGTDLLTLEKDAILDIRGKRIAMIFQDSGAALCPIRTVGDQIYESLREHEKISRHECDRRALEMMAKIGLKDGGRVLKSYPFELSGGMNQRVGICISMLQNPSLLLADEPTSALDVTVQKQVVEEMLLMRREYETAMVVVTHNIGVVEKMADQVLVLKNGEVREYGKTAQVLTAPTDPYTKELMRSVLRLKRAGTGNGGR